MKINVLNTSKVKKLPNRVESYAYSIGKKAASSGHCTGAIRYSGEWVVIARRVGRRGGRVDVFVILVSGLWTGTFFDTDSTSPYRDNLAPKSRYITFDPPHSPQLVGDLAPLNIVREATAAYDGSANEASDVLSGSYQRFDVPSPFRVRPVSVIAPVGGDPATYLNLSWQEQDLGAIGGAPANNVVKFAVPSSYASDTIGLTGFGFALGDDHCAILIFPSSQMAWVFHFETADCQQLVAQSGSFRGPHLLGKNDDIALISYEVFDPAPTPPRWNYQTWVYGKTFGLKSVTTPLTTNYGLKTDVQVSSSGIVVQSTTQSTARAPETVTYTAIHNDGTIENNTRTFTPSPDQAPFNYSQPTLSKFQALYMDDGGNVLDCIDQLPNHGKFITSLAEDSNGVMRALAYEMPYIVWVGSNSVDSTITLWAVSYPCEVRSDGTHIRLAQETLFYFDIVDTYGAADVMHFCAESYSIAWYRCYGHVLLLKFDPNGINWATLPDYSITATSQKVAVLAVTKDDMIMMVPAVAVEGGFNSTQIKYSIISTKGPSPVPILTLAVGVTLIAARFDEANSLLWVLTNTGSTAVQWVIDCETLSYRQMDSASLTAAKPELFVTEPFVRLGAAQGISRDSKTSGIIYERENY